MSHTEDLNSVVQRFPSTVGVRMGEGEQKAITFPLKGMKFIQQNYTVKQGPR